MEGNVLYTTRVTGHKGSLRGNQNAFIVLFTSYIHIRFGTRYLIAVFYVAVYRLPYQESAAVELVVWTYIGNALLTFYQHFYFAHSNLYSNQAAGSSQPGMNRQVLKLFYNKTALVRECMHTWSTLGKYWMRKPRRIPATIPPATSSTPLKRLYQVEPRAKHTPILE